MLTQTMKYGMGMMSETLDFTKTAAPDFWDRGLFHIQDKMELDFIQIHQKTTEKIL